MDLPSASARIDDSASAYGTASDLIAVFACVERNADASSPRLYGSAAQIYEQHGYSQGVDYSALHIEKTKKPVLFVGLPTTVAGAVGSTDTSAVTGTSNISFSAGAQGILDELDVIVTCTEGGVVGGSGVEFNVSTDGGRTNKSVRLGAATSYTIPYVGLVVNFATGTLVAGDVASCRTSAPLWDSAGYTAARTALAAQQKRPRTILGIGDMPDATLATSVVTQLNAYETANNRYVLGRLSVRDKRVAKMARIKKHMRGSPSLTFAEVGATGDTITRSTGSFIDDGFAVGDIVSVTGSASNNVTGPVTAVTATVLTFDTTDLVAEGPVADCAIIASAALTFAEVGATGDTITRTSGSWIADGFKVGDTVVITGTGSNNISAVIAALSATVMTLTAEDLAAEVIAQHTVSIVNLETMTSYIASTDDAFDGIDGEKRIDLSIGRGTVESPFTKSFLRRPAAWAASIEEYFVLDLHLTVWQKDRGPLSGWSLEDVNGKIVELDARTDEAAIAARFTCFRTWGNGPNGTFLACSLTRAPDASVLSRTHNMHVANVACSVVQAETEFALGRVLTLAASGKATKASLSRLEAKVNAALARELLSPKKGQIPRASFAVWRANPDAILSTPGAPQDGVLDLRVNGTLEKIDTLVRVS